TRKYSYRDLIAMTDDTRYQPDWNTPHGKRARSTCCTIQSEFFKVRNISLVVILGTYLYPTALTENRIREMEGGDRPYLLTHLKASREVILISKSSVFSFEYGLP